jgi:hypothetical protein
MERAYDMNPSEIGRAQRLESQNQELLARIGSATLELEQCKAQLPQIRDQQRALLSEIVGRHGIQNFVAARIDGHNIRVQLPDEPQVVPAPAPIIMQQVNGKAEPAKE